MKKRNATSTIDFKILFIMGIIFTGSGVAIGLVPMSMLGLVFMFIGILNRDKWPTEGGKQNEQ